MPSEKKILVTGAAGFIGLHLALRLSQKNDSVIGLDNFNDYYSPQLKKDRANLLEKHGISVIAGDVCDAEVLKNLILEHQITHIVHLAAQAGVRYSLLNPQAYIKSNLEGFVHILDICRAFPSIKLVYASSSSVYGLNHKTPFSETDRTDHQASFYGATKKANELFAFTYHHLYGISAIGLRFFTVYGPWGRPDMAYFSFTKAIMEGLPIEIYNHGKMQRDFTYIDDIVDGIVSAIDQGVGCEVYNLGNHRPVELLHFVELLELAIGKKADKRFLPMQAGDVPATYADIEKSMKAFNFFPKTSLEEGIPLFVDWYKKYTMHAK